MLTEPLDVAVECDAIVVIAGAQCQEVFARAGRLGGGGATVARHRSAVRLTKQSSGWLLCGRMDAAATHLLTEQLDFQVSQVGVQRDALHRQGTGRVTASASKRDWVLRYTL